MELNDLDFLQNELYINKEFPLWWNFNYPKDERRFIPNFKTFQESLINVGKIDGFEFNVSPAEYVPVTILPLEVGGKNFNFFVTIRPYTPKEVWEVNDFKGALEDLALEIHSEKKWPLKDMFLPHLRGFAKEMKNNTLFYYDYHFSENLEFGKLVRKVLDEKGLSLIGGVSFIASPGGVYFGDKIEKVLEDSKSFVHAKYSRRGLLKFSEQKLPDSFKQVQYNDFKISNENLFSYFPLVVDEVEGSIPFALCNNAFGKKGAFCLGVCIGENQFTEIKDKEIARKYSLKLSEIFGFEINPVIFNIAKGSHKYEILRP